MVRRNLNVEEELLDYLNRIAAPSRNKKRNVGLVSHFYGFGDSQWPTYESTAERFGVGSRERVRQILQETFRPYLAQFDLPRLHACADLLQSRKAWIGSELFEALSDSGYASPHLGIKGLLNLMHEISLCVQYDLYNSSFVKVRRADVDREPHPFVIDATMAESLQKALQKARTLPGQLGLASTRFLAPLAKSVDLNVLIAAIRLDPHAWMEPDGEDYWYCLENRGNTLIGMSEKIFALTHEIDCLRLVECLSNGLKARTLKHPYPDKGLILRFIQGSRYFSCENGKARFRGERGALTDIQQAIVRFFRNKAEADWTDISSYLEAAGFGKALISKAVTKSPLVYVNRSLGRGKHTYSLISHARTGSGPGRQPTYKFRQARRSKTSARP